MEDGSSQEVCEQLHQLQVVAFSRLLTVSLFPHSSRNGSMGTCQVWRPHQLERDQLVKSCWPHFRSAELLRQAALEQTWLMSSGQEESELEPVYVAILEFCFDQE